jgi:hypothetical protein
MTSPIFSLAGFRPFLRKELAEWWQRRAALATFVTVAILGTIGTLASRIDAVAGGSPAAADLGPTASVLGAKFEDWVLFAAILTTIGVLTHERASGTLAWTLSKPVSRSSVLLGKWTAGVLVLGVSAVLLPIGVSVLVATAAYGAAPDLVAVTRFAIVLLAVPAFFAALNLALATSLTSQAGIAAIAFGVYGAPYLISAFAPAAAEVWPTSIAAMAGAVATGASPHLPTVVGWAASVAALGGIGLLVFNREDL